MSKLNVVGFVIGIVFFLGLSSCRNNNTEPCDYYEYQFKAKVIALQAYIENGDTLFHIITQFNNSSLSDELQYLEILRKVKPTAAFIRNNRIEIGTTYSGIVNELKSGNCKGLYISFDQKLK